MMDSTAWKVGIPLSFSLATSGVVGAVNGGLLVDQGVGEEVLKHVLEGRDMSLGKSVPALGTM